MLTAYNLHTLCDKVNEEDDETKKNIRLKLYDESGNYLKIIRNGLIAGVLNVPFSLKTPPLFFFLVSIKFQL